ncbi:hypothetical protein GIB67_033211 [Kingdonia uniflora]|uniref:Uncharacterized protein n=1 Tax=Kingdonia uniflora TaxID=39325 RepID=A0A7J7MPQ5_9MAGN|nr:hypothetical protein GIB67_033211 [Kingdonia uniflora]
MGSEPMNLKKPAGGHSFEEDNYKKLDREVREMASALTHRLTNLHQKNKSSLHQHEEDEEDCGIRIITIAGTNTGATMRAELDDISNTTPRGRDGTMPHDHEGFTTYANSNFQAINNSIMLGGSYSCNDPGIHVDTTEDYINKDHHGNKPGNKGKMKVKSDQHSDKSEDESNDD